MVSIKRLRGRELALAPQVFDELRARPQVDCFLVAVNKDNVAVGFAFLSALDEKRNPVYAFDIKTASSDNQFLIAGALKNEIFRIARTHKISRLMKLAPANSEGEIDFYCSAGFQVMRWVSIYEIDLAAILKLVQNAVSISDITARYNLRYESYNCQPAKIDELCLDGFGVLTHGHLQATGNLSDEKDYSQSTSIWMQGELVAALAVGLKDHIATFDPLLVNKQYREKWPFALIVKYISEKLLRLEVKKGHVIIMEDNHKMMSFIAKSAPRFLKRSAVFAQDLTDAV